MIIILAGDADAGAQVGCALACHVPRATVLRPDYFAPIAAPGAAGGQDGGNRPEAAPWLAGALAASAEQIAAQGGTSVVVLPGLAEAAELAAAFGHTAAPLFLFLLRGPAPRRGIFRRAAIVKNRDGDAAARAAEIAADAAAGRGLIRPAPAGVGPGSVLPSAGGPKAGVDIIEIARIARVAERYGERFLRRVYTGAEQALYRGRAPELAARFAAKEAISKALGTGIWGIRWREMEILPDKRGKPLVYLHGAAAARARALNLRHFDVSLSHSREFAIAVVVAT